MLNLDNATIEIMMAEKNSTEIMKVYEELKKIVKDECDREIRFAEAISHTLEQRFEMIMGIQENCNQQLDFLDSAMILFRKYASEIVGEQQEMAKAS